MRFIFRLRPRNVHRNALVTSPNQTAWLALPGPETKAPRVFLKKFLESKSDKVMVRNEATVKNFLRTDPSARAKDRGMASKRYDYQ